MSIWSRITGRAEPVEVKDFTLANPALLSLFGGTVTASGVTIGEATVMRQSVAGACVRLLSSTMGTLPVHVFQKDEDGGRSRADHPAERVNGSFVSPWLSSAEFRQSLTKRAIFDGASYAIVNRIRGAVREIHPIPHSAVKRDELPSGEPVYVISRAGGGETRHGFADVIEIRPFGGRSLAKDAGEAIGIAITLERHAAKLFSNGGRPAGVLKVAGRLTAVAAERIAGAWNSSFGGENSGKTAVLEEGASFESIALKSTDAQFLEMRAMQINEICRAFDVPPVLVGDLSKAVWRNVEELALVFVTYTLLPWLTCWENALERALLTPAERAAGLYIEFDTAGLVRGDLASRMQAYREAISSKVMTPNEARSRENLPRHADGDRLENPNTSSPGVPASPTDEAGDE
jgi:HK97 family phage portal protein